MMSTDHVSYVCGGFASAENQRLSFIIARVVVLLRVQNETLAALCAWGVVQHRYPAILLLAHRSCMELLKLCCYLLRTCRGISLRSTSSPFLRTPHAVISQNTVCVILMGRPRSNPTTSPSG